MREFVLIKLFAPLQFLYILFSVCWCRKQFVTVKVACPSYTPVHSALCCSFSSVCISIVVVLGPIKRHKGANPDLVMWIILLPNLQARWHSTARRTVTIFLLFSDKTLNICLLKRRWADPPPLCFWKLCLQMFAFSPRPSMPGTQLW
jgi:hypothetical protein